MSELLRQYEQWELGADGYPDAWHHESQAADQSNRYAGDGPSLEPPIKDLIRERDGLRCLRCRHPYVKGAYGDGHWSPCSDECTHAGPYALVEPGVELQTRAIEGGPLVPVALEREPGTISQERIREMATERGWLVVAEWRILTVHHLDEDKANCRWWNLVSLCQRCHLRMQRAVVMGRPYSYEHSAWFRPYAAAFYAWKYEGADLSPEEVEARMPELLAYEHRFTQETLL